MRRISWSLLAVVGALAVLMPITANASDLDRARDRVDQLQSDLVEVSDRYEQVMTETERIRNELEDLEDEERHLVERAEQIDQRLSAQARQVYMHGAGSEFETLLAAEGPNVGVERASFFASIQQRENADLQDAISVRTRLEQTRQLMAQREEQLDARSAELAQMRELIEADLDHAEEQVATLEALASRQRQISAGGQQGTYACIFDPGTFRFRDSWGEPRSGGRSHKGTDVFAPIGTPIRAVTDGEVVRLNTVDRYDGRSGFGGLTVTYEQDDQRFYNAHLDAIHPDMAIGHQLQAGDVIGWVGRTGNARGTPPHLHLGWYVDDAAINPYASLAVACRAHPREADDPEDLADPEEMADLQL